MSAIMDEKAVGGTTSGLRIVRNGDEIHYGSRTLDIGVGC
jgi:hypothetical protein